MHLLQLKVFIASPSDVAPERKIIRTICEELNKTVALFRNIVLHPVGWETHCWPDAGSDPQSVILSQITPEDIFIGVIWNKFGTPTPRAASGTVEEFTIAYKQWRSRRSLSHLLFYFKKPTAIENPDELKRIARFKSDLAGRGVLYWEFKSRKIFETELRQHLTNIILRRSAATLEEIPLRKSVTMAEFTSDLDAQLLLEPKTGLIFIDLDNFGLLNVRLGILKADEILAEIIDAIWVICRPKHFPARRVLGDQFAIFVPPQEKIEQLAELVKLSIENVYPGVTASVGTVRSGSNADVMIKEVGGALVVSKTYGKSRVTLAEDLLDDDRLRVLRNFS